MLSQMIRWAIAQRWIVIAGAVALVIGLGQLLARMPLDVFPPFAPPQVEIQTETPGLAPEEVESLVTLPIESAVNGTPGITAIRSASGAGISVVKVIFDWHTDIYLARQLVTERLQQAAEKLPDGVEPPALSPISSPVGLVLQYAITSKTTSLMEVRRLVDWQLTNRLLAVPGVSQVVAYGGEVPQYQVLADPDKLRGLEVSLGQVTAAAAGANQNAAGGYVTEGDRELLVRGLGRLTSVAELGESVVTARSGVPVRLRDVAQVQLGAALKRGDGYLDGQPAVIVAINKQPNADTPTVSRAIEAAVQELQKSFPPDVKMVATFRQDAYIDNSIENVRTALIEGSIIVALVLIPFLMNWRNLAVCLTALPLSLLLGVGILHLLGQGLNTMTLGGLAVAIGSAVDDAIVDAENVYRCLRENQQAATKRPLLEVVFAGCQEVRDSVFGATVITIVVFSPVFALSGVEGSLFVPMGLGYLAAVLASSAIALTVTPALCALLLPHGQLPEREPWLARWFKGIYTPALRLAMGRSPWILAAALAVLVAALVIGPSFGRIFLPEFQEQTLVNTLLLYPGSSLTATNQAGQALQAELAGDDRWQFVQLRSGRAPGDADAAPVNAAHVDIELTDKGMVDRPATLNDIRAAFNRLPGVVPNVGGFISHRMDEVLSGVRSAIAIKIFGPDLRELRAIGQEVNQIMGQIPGIVDLQLEPQFPIEQIQIQLDRAAAARYGLNVEDLATEIETALNGRTVSQVLDRQQLIDLVVWLKPEARSTIPVLQSLLVSGPGDRPVPLGQVATITRATGPNTIGRENVSRVLVVSANVRDQPLRSVVEAIRQQVQQQVTLPNGYYIQYAGQFEAEERASQNILVFSILACIAMTLITYWSVKSIPSTLAIIVNLPIGLAGGIFAIALTGGILSIAALVGFVSLFGVAIRNGLLLVENYNSKYAEGMSLPEIIFNGSMERLNAILMTAFTSALGLLPLAVGSPKPGQELLQPMSIVVLGGLFTSTAITLMVIPALYARFGHWLFPNHLVADRVQSLTPDPLPIESSS